MANSTIAALIAERLPGSLVHPGDPANDQPAKLLPLPVLGSTGIPPEMAKHFAKEAGLPADDFPKLIGEAIVHLIETDGQTTLVPNAELEQLRAADLQPGEVTPVNCAECGQPAFYLSSKGGRLSVGKAAMRALGRVQHVCGVR